MYHYHNNNLNDNLTVNKEKYLHQESKILGLKYKKANDAKKKVPLFDEKFQGEVNELFCAIGEP